MKFVIGEQLPPQFRKCQLNFDNSEFNQGKKKLTDIFTQSTNLEEKQQIQKQLAQKKEEINYQNLQQQNEHENKIFQKHHQKFFGKMVVYPIKIGPKESNKETHMDRQRKKALKLKQEQEAIAKEIYITKDNPNPPDLQYEFFDYLQQMGNQHQSKQNTKSLSPVLIQAKSKKLDRLEQESCVKQRKFIPGLSLKENYQIRNQEALETKEGNTLVLGQSLFEYADTQTKDGIQMQKAIKTHDKTYNRANNKRYATIDISRGRICEMSNQFPPMFQRAKFTKNLYFNTNYQKQYTQQKQYIKPGLRLGPVEFRKNNKVPLLFGQ